MTRPSYSTPLAALALLVALALPVSADDIRLKLKNGDVVTGSVVSETARTLVLRSPYGLLSIPIAEIAGREPVKPPTKPVDPPVKPKDPPKKPRQVSLDKPTRQLIQQSLTKLQTALHDNDAAGLRAMLIGGPGDRAKLDLKNLKRRLGLTRVLLRAISGRRAVTDTDWRVTVNVTAQGVRNTSIRGEEFILRKAGGEWKVVIPAHDLGKRLDVTGTNEKAAIGRLRRIHAAQLAFARAKSVDLDNDGVGEFGFLQELAGKRLRTGKDGPAKPIKALIDAEIVAPLARKTARYGALGGYNFTVFLPGDTKAVAEKGALPRWLPVHANRAEAQFVCYAWPTEYGKTGQRAFVIDRKGKIYFYPGGLYSGANVPNPEAAFSRSATAANNLMSDPKYGLGDNPTMDGQLWLVLGVPYERRLPPGRHRLHIIMRLMLAERLFPNGPVGAGTTPVATFKPDPSSDAEKSARTRREAQALVTALLSYRSKIGRYPPSGNRNLIIHLDGDARNGGPENQGQFHVFFPRRVRGTTYLDPWGRPFRYEAPKPGGLPRVWSLGPNGKDESGKGDDVSG